MERVDGVQLLSDFENYYRKYVRMPEEAYPIFPPWVLHTHTFPAWTRTPYIHLSSPAPECGKTTVLEITELIVPKAWLTMSLSNAVLARKIHVDHPVLLLDEVDQLLAGDKELLAAVMQTVNSGYKKSGRRTILIQAKGKDWEPKDLSTFCPKMLSGIADLPPATKSRCIPIIMERLTRGDLVVQVDEYIVEPEANALFVRAQDWAKAHLKQLRDARPDAPPQLGPRQREVCRPLLAVADAAGGCWPQRIRAALVTIFANVAAEQSSDVKMLALGHIREVLRAHPEDVHPLSDDHAVRSADLCNRLAEIEDGPWSAWGKSSKPITQNQLARQLRGFASPNDVRIDGKSCKGYRISSLQRAFDRYLPLPSDSNRDSAICDETNGLNPDFKARQDTLHRGLENDVSPSGSLNVAASRFKQGDEATAAEHRVPRCFIHGRADCEKCWPTPTAGMLEGAL